MYQPSLSTGNPYNRWMKRNSGGTTGSSTVAGMQNFHLTGQRPQELVGHETNYPYAVGGFPTNNFQMSPTMRFLPIMPVTFSWFPMSQQHKEEFQKMRNQSKFPNSLRPFQRFAAT